MVAPLLSVDTVPEPKGCYPGPELMRQPSGCLEHSWLRMQPPWHGKQNLQKILVPQPKEHRASSEGFGELQQVVHGECVMG